MFKDNVFVSEFCWITCAAHLPGSLKTFCTRERWQRATFISWRWKKRPGCLQSPDESACTHIATNCGKSAGPHWDFGCIKKQSGAKWSECQCDVGSCWRIFVQFFFFKFKSKDFPNLEWLNTELFWKEWNKVRSYWIVWNFNFPRFLLFFLRKVFLLSTPLISCLILVTLPLIPLLHLQIPCPRRISERVSSEEYILHFLFVFSPRG